MNVGYERRVGNTDLIFIVFEQVCRILDGDDASMPCCHIEIF